MDGDVSLSVETMSRINVSLISSIFFFNFYFYFYFLLNCWMCVHYIGCSAFWRKQIKKTFDSLHVIESRHYNYEYIN